MTRGCHNETPPRTDSKVWQSLTESLHFRGKVTASFFTNGSTRVFICQKAVLSVCLREQHLSLEAVSEIFYRPFRFPVDVYTVYPIYNMLPSLWQTPEAAGLLSLSVAVFSLKTSRSSSDSRVLDPEGPPPLAPPPRSRRSSSHHTCVSQMHAGNSAALFSAARRAHRRPHSSIELQLVSLPGVHRAVPSTPFSLFRKSWVLKETTCSDYTEHRAQE